MFITLSTSAHSTNVPWFVKPAVSLPCVLMSCITASGSSQTSSSFDTESPNTEIRKFRFLLCIVFTVRSLRRIPMDRSVMMGFKFPLLPTAKGLLIHDRPVHRGGHSRVKTEVDSLNIHRVLQNTSGRFLNTYHNTNASPNIVRVIKSTRMSWVEHVA